MNDFSLYHLFFWATFVGFFTLIFYGGWVHVRPMNLHSSKWLLQFYNLCKKSFIRIFEGKTVRRKRKI